MQVYCFFNRIVAENTHLRNKMSLVVVRKIVTDYIS